MQILDSILDNNENKLKMIEDLENTNTNENKEILKG